jgi:nicotinamide-nucleotide adenylyltransferase
LKKKKRGLFIGRFQPPHKGHIRVIQRLLEKVDELIIIIGSSQLSHELSNPFTTGERIWMMKSALDEAKVNPNKYFLLPIPDATMHSIWVAQVFAYTPPFEVVFSNDPLTRRLFQEAKIVVYNIEFIQRKLYSATEVRRRMLANENWQVLLPKSIVEIINTINGVQRLTELALTDSPFMNPKTVH